MSLSSLVKATLCACASLSLTGFLLAVIKKPDQFEFWALSFMLGGLAIVATVLLSISTILEYGRGGEINMKKHQSKISFVRLPNNSVFQNESTQRRLWMMTCNMLPKSRRKALDEIASALFHFEGLIFTHNGRLWPIPEDMEAIFCSEGRGLDTYRETTDFGTPKRGVRNLNRLVVLYLYFRIKDPDVADRIIQ